MNEPVTSKGPFTFVRRIGANPVVRIILLTLYYLIIILGLILLYGRGDFSTPAFIYVAF
ncbi:MAG: teichoic acid D-Ala incorporation-associated protein DltX [Anaerolineae bacterium]